MINCVFHYISLCKCPIEKKKQEEEEEGKGRRGRRKILKMHVNNYCKVVGEKHFLVKAIFKNKYLILNEFQLILNNLQFNIS